MYFILGHWTDTCTQDFVHRESKSLVILFLVFRTYSTHCNTWRKYNLMFCNSYFVLVALSLYLHSGLCTCTRYILCTHTCTQWMQISCNYTLYLGLTAVQKKSRVIKLCTWMFICLCLYSGLCTHTCSRRNYQISCNHTLYLDP